VFSCQRVAPAGERLAPGDFPGKLIFSGGNPLRVQAMVRVCGKFRKRCNLIGITQQRKPRAGAVPEGGHDAAHPHGRKIGIGRPSRAFPATPPCVRVRTRRFIWVELSWYQGR
jgi:hypothetical protein